MKSIFKISLIISLFVLVSAVGYLYYQNKTIQDKLVVLSQLQDQVIDTNNRLETLSQQMTSEQNLPYELADSFKGFTALNIITCEVDLRECNEPNRPQRMSGYIVKGLAGFRNTTSCHVPDDQSLIVHDTDSLEKWFRQFGSKAWPGTDYRINDPGCALITIIP